MIQDLEFDIDLKHKTICKEYCKQNDTLNLIFNVYDNGQAVDLTGFTAILNCNINNTNQVIKNSGILINGNKITIFDKEKYITTLGENVKFELVLSKGDVQKTSFNVSLEIEKSVLTTTGHLEEVTITALTNLQDQLNQASETIQKLETANNSVSDKIDKLTTENTKAQTNYDNLKNVNDNLSDLVEANTTATTNINNLTIENNKAAANIEAMQGFGDLTNLAQQVETNKTKIAEHTSQLNDLTNLIEATMSAEQTCANDTNTQLSYDTCRTNDFVELVSGGHGAFKIKKSGIYLISTSIAFVQIVGRCELSLNIRSNFCSTVSNYNNSGISFLHTSRMAELNVGDIICIVAKQSSGASANISSSPAVTLTQFKFLGGN